MSRRPTGPYPTTPRRATAKLRRTVSSTVDIDAAQTVAAEFAVEYLTWSHDESHAERTARIDVHTTDAFRAAIAAAHEQVTADVADDEGVSSQTVEALDTQTVRRFRVEGGGHGGADRVRRRR